VPIGKFERSSFLCAASDGHHSRVRDDGCLRRGDIFLDDVNEGMLVHTKSVLPHETMTRNATCQLGSKHTCSVGFRCPASTEFVDADHRKNVFRDASGKFCNCWVHEHVEGVLLPMMETALLHFSGSW
jgi:hypothetical protein